MQPAFAIPPYTRNVEKLKGLRCQVPRERNPARFWWGSILEVKFISQNTVLVLVSGHQASGRDKWHELKFCRFRKQESEPMLLAIAKARAKESAA